MRNMQPEKVENHCSKYSDNIDILYFTVMSSQYYTAALAESDLKNVRLYNTTKNYVQVETNLSINNTNY